MFFSTATRPTYRKIGGVVFNRAPLRDLKMSRSTPRDQSTTLVNPLASRSFFTTTVGAMTAFDGPWNQRRKAYVHESGMPLRAWTYSGKRV